MSGGRAMPGALEHVQLGRVAALHLVLELVLEALEAVAALLDQRHLVAEAQERARDVRARPCRRRRRSTYIRRSSLRDGISQARTASVERVDRRLRRADGAHPARGVEVGARRVEHADDDAVDAEPLLGDLADDDVRVVAVRRDDDGVGLLDPGLAEQVDVHAVADEERAGPVVAEPRERVLVLVDDGDVPALLLELERDRRADPAAADDRVAFMPCAA